MGIDAVHTKYSTWDGAAKMKKFAKKFKPAKKPPKPSTTERKKPPTHDSFGKFLDEEE